MWFLGIQIGSAKSDQYQTGYNSARCNSYRLEEDIDTTFLLLKIDPDCVGSNIERNCIS